LANSSLRAASHSSCDAIGGWAMFAVVMVRLPPCDSVLCNDSPHPISVVHPFQDFFFSMAIFGLPRQLLADRRRCGDTGAETANRHPRPRRAVEPRGAGAAGA